MTTTFCRYDLRTTDADAARPFYARVLGHDRAPIWPLHENALARGAKPHWLGRIGVDDVERATAAFEQRGATRFQPIGPTADGGRGANFRDPGGALVAVGTPPPAGTKATVDVVWHALNTGDLARAIEDYRALFGWTPTEQVDLGALGTFQQFAWDAGGASVGSMTSIAGMPGRHPHWLFFHEVDALDAAIAATRDGGGLALDPIVLPGGQRACVCDDPQGAAFGLRERRG